MRPALPGYRKGRCKKRQLQANIPYETCHKNPHTYIVNGPSTKVPKIQNGKRKLFNKWYLKNWIYICKRLKLDLSLTPYTKIILEWIKNLNEPKTVKLLEENREKQVLDIGFGSGFLDITPKPRQKYDS